MNTNVLTKEERIFDLEELPAAFAEIYQADDDEPQASIFDETYLAGLEAQAKARLLALMKENPPMLALSEQIHQLRGLMPTLREGKVRAAVNKDAIACVLELCSLV